MILSNHRTYINLIARTVVLTYGGAAVLGWVSNTFLGAASEENISWYARWLRDGTLALPVVAVAVLLLARRSAANRAQMQPGRLMLPAIFAAIMGAGAVLHMLFPATHDISYGTNTGAGYNLSGVGTTTSDGSTFSALWQVVLVMVVAGIYAAVADGLLLAALDVLLAKLRGVRGPGTRHSNSFRKTGGQQIYSSK